MQTIVLYKKVVEEIIQAATKGKPFETCGLIAKDGDGVCVGQWEIPSLVPSPISFQMEPHAQIAAMTAFESEGLEWAGIWHSHPDGPAWPSATDIGQSVNWPNIFMLIFSLSNPDPQYGAFLVTEGKVTQLDVTLISNDR